MIRLRSLLFAFVCVVFGMLGWSGYNYFFDTTLAQLQIEGIVDEKTYAGEVACTICATKRGELSLWVDGQPLVTKCSLRGSDYPYSFAVSTKTLQNGRHNLKAEFVDSSYAKNKVTREANFMVDNVPLQAVLIKSDSDCKVFQGRTLHVQLQANKKIKNASVSVFSQTYKCFPESKNSLVYECFIPVDCQETPTEYLLSLDVADYVGNVAQLDSKFQVVLFPFKKVSLELSVEKVKEEESLGLDTKLFEEEVARLTAYSVEEKLWRGPFCTPIEIQRITGEFGTIRTTQHKGRYAHKALDIINQPKSVVWAPQDGIVVLKDRYAASGNTVVIDHGYGILSMFFHLDSFAKVEVGDKISKGNPLGTIGKTGYAKGYHLHWEMRVNNVAIDPMQWTKVTF